MIYLLWPTVRPDMMMDRYAQWIKAARNPDNVEIRIAVNTQEQAKILKDSGFPYVLICGDKIRGVAPAAYALSSRLKANSRDIVILASDDFCAPQNWDFWVMDQLNNYNGCLLINDGYQPGGTVTLPIMTFECLKQMKHIIYHPEYLHLYSDAELYDNLKKLRMLKNLRKKSPIFEHRHWANGKRKFDTNDSAVSSAQPLGLAKKVYEKRMKLGVAARLKISQKWKDYNAAVKLA